MDSAIKGWHETGMVDPRVNFLLDTQKSQTDKFAPVVNIDKVIYILVFTCSLFVPTITYY